MEEKLTEVQKTLIIINCESYKELKAAVLSLAPFISYSRGIPKEWTAEMVLDGITAIKAGHPINRMTRANGLRAKVAELILANDYGDNWNA
jgi:hypothetical protein